MVNSIVEGYPGRRYHAGAGNMDTIENLEIERAAEMRTVGHLVADVLDGLAANRGDNRAVEAAAAGKVAALCTRYPIYFEGGLCATPATAEHAK